MTTLYASSAVASAAYYTQYLTQAVGEVPGVWHGAQADGLGLTGVVSGDALRLVLEGRDPTSATPLGMPLVDRYKTDGSIVRAVAGFDATFSSPKSVSVLWALTGDNAILDIHDQAVRDALGHLERFGATTRVRVNGARMHPDTGGLTMAVFRQSTSRADDPQLHTHVVISTKVQTDDGRWWALDARYLKRHQRMLGGLYQSTLRSGMVERFGVAWEPIVNGQAEITGMPPELLTALSKRTAQVDELLEVKLAEFRGREGRDPSRWERAALTREAAVDSRAHKSGVGVADLVTRWHEEAAQLGWTAASIRDAVVDAARDAPTPVGTTIDDVVDRLSASGSTWARADVVRAICDLEPAHSVAPERWADAIERATDRVVDTCVALDPADDRVRRRTSDGRSVWIEPTANQYTSDAILTQEEHILAWAIDRQADSPVPSATIDPDGLDVMQAAAAAAVAGEDPLVLVEGPAGAGKTRMLAAAFDDLTAHGRPVFGLAPSARAARVLETDTGLGSDTIAKLLAEHARPDRPPLARYQWPAGTTIIVDEAGMIGTPTLARLVEIAEASAWRLVLVGDPRQLHAVGRGGLFAELCATGRIHTLDVVHRFNQPWEAAASLKLRHGDPAVFDTYHAHARIHPGSVDTHLHRLALEWCTSHQTGYTVAITATTNDHVDAINHAIQQRRAAHGDLDRSGAVAIGGGEHAGVGDVVVTRRNDRTLDGDMVRNRDRWTITNTHQDGSLTVTPFERHGHPVRLPVDYVCEHVRLGYAATEHGNQGVTVDVAFQLVTNITTRRGLYVGATRGRDHNEFLVVTATNEIADARDILDRVTAFDGADIPAVAQRRQLDAIRPAAPTPEPVAMWVAEPDWLADWRHRLREQRGEILDRIDARNADRQHATDDLLALQPALQLAADAWQPYQDRLDELEQQLTSDLRPAMYRANSARHGAGFGHRHGAERAARTSNAAVHDAEEQQRAIRDEGHNVKDRYDKIRNQAGELRQRATQDAAWPIERTVLSDIDRLVDAIDTWRHWNTGQPVRPAALVDSLDTLSREARRAHTYAIHPGEITRQEIGELAQPLGGWLVDRGLIHHRSPHIEREHDIGLGIEL